MRSMMCPTTVQLTVQIRPSSFQLAANVSMAKALQAAGSGRQGRPPRRPRRTPAVRDTIGCLRFQLSNSLFIVHIGAKRPSIKSPGRRDIHVWLCSLTPREMRQQRRSSAPSRPSVIRQTRVECAWLSESIGQEKLVRGLTLTPS